MKPETAVLAVIAFALGALAMDIGYRVKGARTPMPVCAFAPLPGSVPAKMDPLLCQHYRAIGRGWMCGGSS